MKLSALLVQSVLAAAALALPSKLGRGLRLTQRETGNDSTVSPTYNPTWAGVVLNAPQGTYQSVSATINVPTPKEPAGATGRHAASAWVGIDGDSCQNAILQTGVDFHTDGREVWYHAWYEWWPADTVYFDSLGVEAGDSLLLSVAATSPVTGSATITNVATNQTVTQELWSAHALCMQDADWIVEDYGDRAVPFADFGTVAFAGAQARTAAGATVGPQAAGEDTMDIKQHRRVLTSVETTDSSVTVTYIGDDAAGMQG